MTTLEALKKQLTDNGMFDNQAESVLALAIPEIEQLVPDYQITWNRPASEYPDQMFDVWSIVLKKVALKWIEKNAPQAWFKPCFE